MQIIKYGDVNKKLIIEKASEILKLGGVVIFPTETCYGLGVDASNQSAVDKLYLYKKKREGKAVSVAVSSIQMARRYVSINKVAEELYDKYLPGPLTIISKSLGKLARGIESEQGDLGVRIPDYNLILEIIENADRAITVTSANISHEAEPYSIDFFLKNTPKDSLDLVDLIIDAGQLARNEVSTVVDTSMNKLRVIRKGGVKIKNNENKQNL